MRHFVLESSIGIFKSDVHSAITGSLMTLIGKIPTEEIILKIRNVSKKEETPFKGTPDMILYHFKKAIDVIYNGSIIRNLASHGPAQKMIEAFRG